MTKQLVTIEFRYHNVPTSEFSSGYATKKITIGVYDTLKEAINEGNKALDKLSKYYKFNEYFSLHGGCFGNPNRLVTDGTISNIFAQIEELKYDDVEETAKEVKESNAKYNKWRKRFDDE